MTKYTLKLILWEHNSNKDGQYPIYIKMTINRKTSYKSTGHYLFKKDWDEKTQKIKPTVQNFLLLNARLLSMKSEWETKVITTQLKGSELSASQLKQSFRADYTNIFEYVDKLIVKLKGKKSEGTLENYRKHLKKLEEYNGSRELPFDAIDITFLQNYEQWLRKNIKFRKEGPQKNYIHAIWKTFMKWFNSAKNEGIVKHYPFDNYENPIYVSPDKDYLTSSELTAMEEFADNSKDPVLKESAIYFLFGCYSGLRISDWYQFNPASHIKEKTLRLRPRKGENLKNKWVEMVINKPLQRNLTRMQVVPLILQEPTINEKLKIIAGHTGINKHLTTHTGRHTFAVTICLGNKISSETAAELMGISLNTFVKNYSQVTQEKINKETATGWRNMK